MEDNQSQWKTAHVPAQRLNTVQTIVLLRLICKSNTIGSSSPSWRHCLADSNASGKLRGSEYWGQGHRKGRIQLENLRFLVSDLTTKEQQLGQSARSYLWGQTEPLHPSQQMSHKAPAQ